VHWRVRTESVPSGTNSRRRYVAVLGPLAALSLTILAADTVRAQLPPANVLCRNTLATAVAKLAKTAVLAESKCHRLRNAGIVPAATDCSDPTQTADAAKVARAAARLTRLAGRRCADASVPASLGFTSCPQPCAGAIGDYPGVGQCLGCLTQQWIGGAARDAYGAQPPIGVGGDAARCVRGIGTALRTYLTGRMRAQQRCQLTEDRMPAALDCRTADGTGAIAFALEKSQRQLGVCSDAALSALTSCAAASAPEQTCMQQLTELYADDLFNAVYRPGQLLPTPTATAMTPTVPTATATETRTVTATPTATHSATRTATATPTNTASVTPTRTDTGTATATRTPSNTPLPPTPTWTGTVTSTVTNTPTLSPTPADTPTVTVTLTPTRTPTPLPPVHVDITPFPGQSTAPCLIFVHGKRTDTGTFTDWNQARNYWVSGSNDFIRTATKNFTTPYYVVNYNGTQPYWHAESAGVMANQIVNATEGGADGGGNRCARTYAEGGTFWLVGHSMAGSLIDFVLGNADPNDPNYDLNGPYDVAAARISLAVTIAGTHRGSQGADFVCGQGNPLCSFFAQFVQSCDDATYWLQSADAVQVRNFASPPSRTVWLAGGYAAIIGASSCLAGEDDGLVQHASAYACDGSATAAYNNQTVCGNNFKQAPFGFKNLDTAHETHDQERNDTTADTRLQIPDGIWVCNGVPCSVGTTVQNAMSSATFVRSLY
jgi:hypothetical protein